MGNFFFTSFFLWAWFFFFNKFGWLRLFFFGCLPLFVLFIDHFFNKGIWVNLYKFIFFSSLHFSTSNQTQNRENKISFILTFSLLPYFLPFHFFIFLGSIWLEWWKNKRIENEEEVKKLEDIRYFSLPWFSIKKKMC